MGYCLSNHLEQVILLLGKYINNGLSLWQVAPTGETYNYASNNDPEDISK